MRRICLLAGISVLSACGGAASEVASPEEAATTSAGAPDTKVAATPEGTEPKAEEPKGIPEACDGKDKLCLPPKSFAKRVCGSGFHPDLALHFFGKSSPFSRGYLAMNVNAWNASGGASSADKLVFDEEIIVLLERKADTGGMQVSGAGGSYDVLRWDGTCSTLSSEELTFNAPPKPKTAKVAFKDLSEETQSALLQDEKIKKVNADRKKECKGVSMGEVSAKCVKLVDQLSESIVEYVRNGGAVPKPTKLP